MDSFKQVSSKPEQTVLVLQGGGALGAYQAGVFEALHDAGIEPDWVIGTSIGAINAAIIATNSPSDRVAALKEFWQRIETQEMPFFPFWDAATTMLTNWSTVTQGVPGFFSPNNNAMMSAIPGLSSRDNAALYDTSALEATLQEVTNFDSLSDTGVRLSVGAVNVISGSIRYFDSHTDKNKLSVQHILASGALPPAFPAVVIDGEPYWDGGIVSNTPIEVMFDDPTQKNALVFAVNLWQLAGHEPTSVMQSIARQKDIQYASRADSHIEEERKIIHLKKVIRELGNKLPSELLEKPEIAKLLDEGDGRTMHIARLFAPALEGEDQSKDIDFSRKGIRSRWQAGFLDATKMINAAPWDNPCDPLEGIRVHTLDSI